MVTVLSFSAKWCGPCRAAKPTLWELKALGWDIREYDVDNTDPSKFEEYNVSTLPFFVVRTEDDILLKTADVVELKDFLDALH